MLTIRKNGGASVVSLPRSVLKALGVDNGSQLAYTIHGNTLSLTPVEKEKTLEELFEGVADNEYAAFPEDKTFLEAAPVGKEVF